MTFVIQTVLNDELIQWVDQMTQEFIQNKGYITCEFSIQEKYLVAMHSYIFLKNRELPSYGMWRIFKCETCISNNPKHPYHVEIMVVDERPAKELE